MSKIISLSKVRKDKARMEKRVQADANALRFGKTKAEKMLESARAAKAARDLDGHTRDPE